MLRNVIPILAIVGAACSPSAPTTRDDVPDASPARSRTYALGEFPEFPEGSLPESISAELQALLDETVEEGTFTGVTAAVIVADRGSWKGAAGLRDGVPMTTDSWNPTHSSSKTIVAAEVLRLVEDGELGLDDPASEHLPPELGFFDANGATIRQVLGMRSGIPALKEFVDGDGYYPAERASTPVEVFRMLSEPKARPGTASPRYASTNYVLLGTIIEHAMGRPLAEALRSGVLDHPGLEGLDYLVENAMAADGWGVQARAASLARWGYELYGGHVLSDASLRDMTDFQGDWYGLGVMDFSSSYGTLAVGHAGESSVTTCCSEIRLVALPEEGMVIAVQANTDGATASDFFTQVGLLTRTLRAAAR